MCVIDKTISCIYMNAKTNLLWLTAARLLTAPRDKKHAGGMFLPLETAETGSIGSGQRARRPCFKEKDRRSAGAIIAQAEKQ